MIQVKDFLLRIAKLYQIPNFDAESAVLLAEWVLDEYKHTKFEIVQQALSKPPLSKDKSWRLTPETIGDWIEVTRTRIIDEQSRKESEARQTAKVEFPEVSDKVDKMLNEAMRNLKEMDTPSQREAIKAEMKALKKEDKERQEGRKAVASNRRNWDVVVEDAEGNLVGKIERVYAESQEQANEIVNKLIERKQIKL